MQLPDFGPELVAKLSDEPAAPQECVDHAALGHDKFRTVPISKGALSVHDADGREICRTLPPDRRGWWLALAALFVVPYAIIVASILLLFALKLHQPMPLFLLLLGLAVVGAFAATNWVRAAVRPEQCVEVVDRHGDLLLSVTVRRRLLALSPVLEIGDGLGNRIGSLEFSPLVALFSTRRWLIRDAEGEIVGRTFRRAVPGRLGRVLLSFTVSLLLLPAGFIATFHTLRRKESVALRRGRRYQEIGRSERSPTLNQLDLLGDRARRFDRRLAVAYLVAWQRA